MWNLSTLTQQASCLFILATQFQLDVRIPLQCCSQQAQVFQAGAAINVFIAGYVADKWGRKAAFHYCGLLSIFGGAMLCGSRNVAMFIVARFFAGAGSWGYLAVSMLRFDGGTSQSFADQSSALLFRRVGPSWPPWSYGRDEWCQHCLGLWPGFLYVSLILFSTSSVSICC
jgi:MFS family permease